MKSYINFIYLTAISVFLVNCSPYKSTHVRKAELAGKSLLVSTVDVTDPNRPSEEEPSDTPTNNPDPDPDPVTENDPDPDPEVPPPPPPPPPPPVVVNNPLIQKVNTVCSNDSVAAMGGSVTSAKDLRAIVKNSSGSVLCTINDAKIRATLINEHRLELTRIPELCPAAKPGQFTVELKGSGTKNLLTRPIAANDKVKAALAGLNFAATSPVYAGLKNTTQEMRISMYNFYYGLPVPYAFKGILNSTGGLNFSTAHSSEKPAVLMNRNVGGNYGNVNSTKDCDIAVSPLLVQIHPGLETPRPLEFTAPLDGKEFDILGRRSYPLPHTKKLISWFTPESAAGNYFIVMPNAQGRVEGINEMFGDNTLGPDNDYAPNGYAALAKWDGRLASGGYDLLSRDGLITEDDDVFSKLRLWSDINGNAVAEPSELFTLRELGVVSIDLDYLADYANVDKYKNKILMKSSVKTRDGLEHVMYDVWFRLID